MGVPIFLILPMGAPMHDSALHRFVVLLCCIALIWAKSEFCQTESHSQFFGHYAADCDFVENQSYLPMRLSLADDENQGDAISCSVSNTLNIKRLWRMQVFLPEVLLQLENWLQTYSMAELVDPHF